MNVIEDFLGQYSRQYDYYSKLAKIGSNLLELELEKRGIKAIVSFRAKRPERLQLKLEQRNEKLLYKTVGDVFEDIVDLAGVRVALYFPKDRELVEEIINDLFNVKKSKIFPEKTHQPKFEKRFSGYWASHYRVKIKNASKNDKRYESALFEIQVASVLMHAWSEVEHDLVYKPFSGELSEEEFSILDEINGLVLTGEIALERLQKAITKRTKETGDISNRFELTSLITNSLNKNYISKLKLGDTKLLFNLLKDSGKVNPHDISNYLNKINQSEKETITDQLFTMILNDTFSNSKKDMKLTNYFKRSLGNTTDVSGFESFVKTWIILEEAVSVIYSDKNKHHKKFFTAKFEPLASEGLITKLEAIELNQFKRIRNNLLHGVETPNDEELNIGFIRLMFLAEKLISSIENNHKKEKLMNDIASLRN